MLANMGKFIIFDVHINVVTITENILVASGEVNFTIFMTQQFHMQFRYVKKLKMDIQTTI